MQGKSFGVGRASVVAAFVLAGVAATSRAAIITGWGAETGSANGTVTDDGGGAFHTTAPTGNLAPRALLASPITLANDGDGIRFSGSIATGGQINGNDSLRFALVNSNGAATGTLSAGAWTGANPNGWLGYAAEVGNVSNNSGSFVVIGRLTSNAGGWFSGTGSYTLGTALTNGSVPGGASTYDFNISIQRLTSTTLRVGYNFIQTSNGTYSNSAAFTDTGSLNGGAVSTMTFNAVGFLQNATSGGASSFTNLQVNTFVPEPATAALVGLSGLVLARRRGVR